MRDSRKILASVLLILIGVLLAALVAVTLRAAERRFDRAEAGLQAQDEQLAALASAYETAAARDEDLPTLEEIIGSLADDFPQPIPGPQGEPGRDAPNDPDPNDPEVDDPDPDDSDPDDLDPNDPDPNDPELDDPEPNDADPNDPDPDDPEIQDPEIDDPALACPPGYTLTPIHIGNFDAIVCVLNP